MEDLQVNKNKKAASQFANGTGDHHMMFSFRLSRLNSGGEWAMLMPEFSACERNARP